jgi:hypothetical protein
MPCILFEKLFILSPIFSLIVLRNFCRYYLGMTEKAHKAAAFVLVNSEPFVWTGLILSHMLGGVCAFIFI